MAILIALVIAVALFILAIGAYWLFLEITYRDVKKLFHVDTTGWERNRKDK